MQGGQSIANEKKAAQTANKQPQEACKRTQAHPRANNNSERRQKAHPLQRPEQIAGKEANERKQPSKAKTANARALHLNEVCSLYCSALKSGRTVECSLKY